METTFLAMVEQQTAITALVGSGVDTRLYPLKLPQKPTFPAITYQVISGPRAYTQDGPDRVTTFRVQANLYGGSYDQCVALRDAVRDSLSGLNNQAFGSPPVKVKGVFIANERDTYEEGLDQTPDGGPYRKSVDLLVTVKE